MITINKRKSNTLTAVVITVAVFVAFCVFVIVMLSNASATSEEQALQAVNDSVIRAAVTCYAIEGFYPNSIEYLVEHYNLRIDLDRYLIYYSRIADNIMPTVIISVKGGSS
jgi:hypothetical protein